MAEIVLMTYTRVSAGVTVRPMTPRPHDAKVDAFLLEHVAALRQSGELGNAPMARFQIPGSHALFECLRAGDATAFYDAARELAVKLVARMDGRMDPGLLVCVQVRDGEELSGAALKLQVVTPNAAVLERLDSGEEQLAGATNVLDAPGDLQKGALVPDGRPDSDVIVGDKLPKDALYFPEAFDIRSQQRGADSAGELIQAIGDTSPVLARQAARALPAVEAGRVASVLEELAGTVLGLDAALRSDIATKLDAARRPVRDVDTQAPVREIVRVEGITIAGSAAAMSRVAIDPDPAGDGWVITIRTRTRPVQTFKR